MHKRLIAENIKRKKHLLKYKWMIIITEKLPSSTVKETFYEADSILLPSQKTSLRDIIRLYLATV